MSLFNFFDLSSLLSTTIWLLLDAVMLIAGILLFRVEKRFFSVYIIIGAAIGMFINIDWVYWSWVNVEEPPNDSSQ